MASSVDQGPRKSNSGGIPDWKNKSEQSNKADVLREIRKLEVQIQGLEQEKSTHIYNRHSDFKQDFEELQEIDKKNAEGRKTEKIKLRQQLEKISHMVKRFQHELTDIKPTPEFVEKLKIIMEEIEGTISSFKEQQRNNFETLMIEERMGLQEIQALDKRFEAWSHLEQISTTPAPNSAKPPSSARDITKDLPPEVAAFERFVQQSGGVRGGWDEYEHQTFLKFRNKLKGNSVFMEKLLPALSTRTAGEITDHENWYQEYLFLNDVKKDSIKKWRENKEMEKDDILTKMQNSNSEDEEVARKQAAIQAKMDEEKRERHSKLNAWKVQKELEKLQAEERKMRETLLHKQKLEQQRKQQEQMRAVVQAQKQQREQEEEFLHFQQEQMEQEELEKRRQIAARGITRFRERDQKTIAERLAKENSKQKEEREKELRLERLKSQVEVSVTSDPSRLLQPTQGWKERLKDLGPVSTGPLLHMPHRAIPSWRQGLY